MIMISKNWGIFLRSGLQTSTAVIGEVDFPVCIDKVEIITKFIVNQNIVVPATLRQLFLNDKVAICYYGRK